MVRNAAIAAGNSGDTQFVPILLTLLDDEEPQVRGAAIWALSRLDTARFAAERQTRLAAETDAAVRDEWLNAPTEAR